MRIGEVLTITEYINRDDLLKAAWDKPTLALSVYDIGNIKPVDVAPVRHGRWERTADGAALCTACKRKTNPSQYGYAFCGLCGAKMDLEG